MYFTPTISVLTLLTVLAVILGNLYFSYRMLRKSLEHSAKCCGCDKTEQKPTLAETVVDKAAGFVGSKLIG